MRGLKAEVFQAFRSIGISEENALAAATALSEQDQSIPAIAADVSVLKTDMAMIKTDIAEIPKIKSDIAGLKTDMALIKIDIAEIPKDQVRHRRFEDRYGVDQDRQRRHP
jgi:hypothetical protein